MFVLAEFQQLTAPEIADRLAINLNTTYARIRVARQEFKAAYQRRQGSRTVTD